MSFMTKHPQNIPFSISLLYNQEYNNIILKNIKRRAFSEKSIEKKSENSPQLKESAGQKVSNIQMFHLEVVA